MGNWYTDCNTFLWNGNSLAEESASVWCLRGAREWFGRRFSLPLSRLRGRQIHTIQFSYEKAGLRVVGEPIPWNAEAVLVEAIVRLPANTAWRKSDFQLRTPGSHPSLAVQVDPAEEDWCFRVLFRLPPLSQAADAVIAWQGYKLASLRLPFLSADDFFRALYSETPGVYVRLGEVAVACEAFVEEQGDGLAVCGVFRSPTSLVPLLDSSPAVTFTDAATGLQRSVAVRLTASQLLGHQAVVSVCLPRRPLYRDGCAIRWVLRNQVLNHSYVRAVSRAALEQSLYVVDAYYVYHNPDGRLLSSHHLPAREGVHYLRPCFLIASREPGIAALCPLEVRMQFRDPSRPPVRLAQEVLVTDGPSRCLPCEGATVEDCHDIRSFELLNAGRVVGSLPVNPTPAAIFTGEGGFIPSEEYDWTPLTEEELVERLQRLMLVGREESSLRS
jgi:hypothetical protein